MSSKKPCSRCRSPMNTDARGDLCRECWRVDKIDKRVSKPRKRKHKRQSPLKPCSVCGARTRGVDGVCARCSEEVSSGRVRFIPEKPETCPSCAGLPWRRGEKVGDVCAVCGLAWESEELPPLAYYLCRDVERTIAVGGGL